DDTGNGGYAYKQSIKILEMATKDLEHKIIESDLKELTDYPKRRQILQETLAYDHLQKLFKKNTDRDGKKLAMDYVVNPPSVKILKPYYEAFMGKTDGELDQASLEVQKRLLHEASHIWGFNEDLSEKFAISFLKESNPPTPTPGAPRPTNQLTVKTMCICLNGRSDLGKNVECENVCWNTPYSNSPMLYLEFVLGDEILLHPKLGNLYNWCNVMLDGDVTAPSCNLSAKDGFNRINNIPVSIYPGENILTANLQQLAYDRTYIMKLYEGKTGSNAQSNQFSLKREKNNTGRTDIGGNCTNDFECNSLCCNSSKGSCAPHNPDGADPIFCTKEYGQHCMSKEFCKIESVVTCKIVKSGMKADGTQACTLRCPAVPTFGDCIENTCVPPKNLPIPSFDPNDCSQAVDP
ncbi:MAG: hypothetical protein PHY93_21565, partial [Bacteriovorax sp.]|nr:hypothetical protein [Bacteriovorax sp.]